MSDSALDSRCEGEIRQVIADQQRAICQKKIDRTVARYAEKAVVFALGG